MFAGVRADVAGEDGPRLDAGAQRQAASASSRIVPERAKHPLFVLARARRRAGRQVELAASTSTSDSSHVIPRSRRRPRRPPAEHVQRSRKRLRPLRSSSPSMPANFTNATVTAVLALAARELEVAAQRRGERTAEVVARDRVGARRCSHQARAAGAATRPLARPRATRRSTAPAVSALTNISAALRQILELDRRSVPRPRDEQLAVRRPSGRSDRPGRLRRDIRSCDRPDGLIVSPACSMGHCMPDAARQAAHRMPVAGEEQQERVAAELQDVAAVPLARPRSAPRRRRRSAG